MREELDRKLVEDFPLLYRERGWSMQQTCMCWGFPGDGWYDLIYELSSKLEALIQKHLDENPLGKCECGCPVNTHYSQGPCDTIHEMPHRASRSYGYCIPELWKDLIVRYPENKRYAVRNWWRNFRRMIKFKVGQRINRWILNPLFKWRIAVKRVPCGCQEYHWNHPRASQVKEKFGTMSFYMSTGNKEIWSTIDKACKKSAVTCEVCGQPGVLRGGGWIRTLCDACAKEEGKEITHKEWTEEREAAGNKLHTIMSVVPREEA